MIFVIFTAEGLEEVRQQALEEKAVLWLNPALITGSDLTELVSAGIQIHPLPDDVDGSNEKAVLAALNHVESQSPKTEIFVEYL